MNILILQTFWGHKRQAWWHSQEQVYSLKDKASDRVRCSRNSKGTDCILNAGPMPKAQEWPTQSETHPSFPLLTTLIMHPECAINTEAHLMHEPKGESRKPTEVGEVCSWMITVEEVGKLSHLRVIPNTGSPCALDSHAGSLLKLFSRSQDMRGEQDRKCTYSLQPWAGTMWTYSRQVSCGLAVGTLSFSCGQQGSVLVPEKEQPSQPSPVTVFWNADRQEPGVIPVKKC